MACAALTPVPCNAAGGLHCTASLSLHRCRPRLGLTGQPGCTYIHHARKKIVSCEASTESVGEWAQRVITGPLVLGGITLAAIGLLAASAPASAELQTVPPDTALAAARPLPKQQVKKGEVWLLFLLGATGTFGLAVALESQERFFPAIVRANKALAATRKSQEEKEKRKELMEAIEAQMPPEERLQDAVSQGLLAARAKGDSADVGVFPGELRREAAVEAGEEAAEGAVGPPGEKAEKEGLAGTSGEQMRGELAENNTNINSGASGASPPNGSQGRHPDGEDSSGTAEGHDYETASKKGGSGAEVGLDEWMRLRSEARGQSKEKAASS